MKLLKINYIILIIAISTLFTSCLTKEDFKKRNIRSNEKHVDYLAQNRQGKSIIYSIVKSNPNQHIGLHFTKNDKFTMNHNFNIFKTKTVHNIENPDLAFADSINSGLSGEEAPEYYLKVTPIDPGKYNVFIYAGYSYQLSENMKIPYEIEIPNGVASYYIGDLELNFIKREKDDSWFVPNQLPKTYLKLYDKYMITSMLYDKIIGYKLDIPDKKLLLKKIKNH